MRRVNRRTQNRWPAARQRGRRWPNLRFWKRLSPSEPWRRRFMFTSGALTLLGVLLGDMYWFDKTDVPGRAAAGMRDAAIDATKWAGFAIREVYVAGRKETARHQLIKALNVEIGASILDFDPAEARRQLIRLGWIEDARIERHLPDKLHIFLRERRPIAIWQRKNRFVLVDKHGSVIGRDGLSRYRHLKVIVGDGAPDHAADLLSMMEGAPKLMKRVTHAVWVGRRRWNLRIEDTIDIRLPADNPERAWKKLTEMDREFGLLKRDIDAVDLRIPDRLTVRRNHKARGAARADGRT